MNIGEDCLCNGQVNSLTLEYQGNVTVKIEVVQQQGGSTIFLNNSVNPGQSFNFIGSGTDGRMGPEIDIFINGQLSVEIHTSCSQPIEIGMTFGLFKIIAGTSTNNGDFCTTCDGQLDCNGICNGPHILDCKGVCYDPTIQPPPNICECGPDEVPDCFGICGGNGIRDCGGVCYDPTISRPTNLLDCNGNCYDGGQLPPFIPDCYGECFDRNTTPPHVPDCNGVCNGDGIVDCNGICNGDAYEDCGKNCIDPCPPRLFYSRNSRFKPVKGKHNVAKCNRR